jgi:hypothetical protein
MQKRWAREGEKGEIGGEQGWKKERGQEVDRGGEKNQKLRIQARIFQIRGVHMDGRMDDRKDGGTDEQ